MKQNHTRSHGYTMVELLVSLVVSFILIGGIVQVTATQKIAYRIQHAVNILNENARFAVQFMDYSLRMSDHWGGIESRVIRGDPASSGPGTCGQAWINDVGEALRGYDGGAVAPLGCVQPASDYQPGTDMLVVRYAKPEIVLAPAAGGIYLRTALGRQGILFEGSEGVPTALPDEDGTYTFPYVTELYYVRRCSSPGGGDDPDACDANDDDGNPIPMLIRLRLNDNGQMSAQPLVEGVEDLQLRFGLDFDMDSVPDQYADPANIAPDQWDDVVTAELNIVVRGFSKGTHSGKGIDFPVKSFIHVVQLRNRSRS